LTIKELEYKLFNYYDHRGLNDAINYLDGLKAAHEALYSTSGGMDYSGMPHSSTPSEPPLEAVIRMQDKPEKLRAEIKQAQAQIIEITETNGKIEKALHNLAPIENEIIHLRHCERMKWGEISKATYYSESRIKHKYFEVLRKIINSIQS
jgi:DNA-directed RNA polymerase specialized sigma24 family protein